MTTKQAAQAMRDNLKSLKISIGTGSMSNAVYVEASRANSLFSDENQRSIKDDEMTTRTTKTPLIKSLSDAALRDHYWWCRELAYNNMQMVSYCGGRRCVDKLGRQMGWLMKQIDICEAVARQRRISLARD